METQRHATSPTLTRLQVFRLAVPVILAQAATATTGVVDTVVMGRFGDKTDLAAVAIASVAFGFIYWGFGFLRMATTGLTAQAEGAGRHREVEAILQRSVLLGAALGCLLLVLAIPIKSGMFLAFPAEPLVEHLGGDYFDARIWGAPALLITYGLNGWLLAKGRTGQLLLIQVVMNGANAILDTWFVVGLDWGPAGIGAGTAIAEWIALALGFFLVRRNLRPTSNVFDRAALLAMFTANRDIMIRTLALLFCFFWFTRSGTLMGTAVVAGNEVLLQFITVAAFVLDGFAFIAEKETGEAYGTGQSARVRRAFRITSELALGFGAVIALIYLALGPAILTFAISDSDARSVALTFLPYCALVPLIGIPTWQLDGLFIGTTQGRALRLAGLASAGLYVGTDILLRTHFGNTGVWTAFLLMYVYRAGSLAVFLPPLFQGITYTEATKKGETV